MTCPNDAINEVERTIGVIEGNEKESFLQGKLNVSEPISIPILRDLKKRIQKDKNVIIDCPPGASCTVVQSIEDCDYCVLVTEPTPFGLHDLNIAVQLVRKMKIPFGIVLNKASDDSKIIHEFCEKEGIDLLLEIPFSQDIAEKYSRGILPASDSELWTDKFKTLYEKIERGAKK